MTSTNNETRTRYYLATPRYVGPTPAGTAWWARRAGDFEIMQPRLLAMWMQAIERRERCLEEERAKLPENIPASPDWEVGPRLARVREAELWISRAHHTVRRIAERG